MGDIQLLVNYLRERCGVIGHTDEDELCKDQIENSHLNETATMRK
jgi:hypothetical protein